MLKVCASNRSHLVLPCVLVLQFASFGAADLTFSQPLPSTLLLPINPFTGLQLHLPLERQTSSPKGAQVVRSRFAVADMCQARVSQADMCTVRFMCTLVERITHFLYSLILQPQRRRGASCVRVAGIRPFLGLIIRYYQDGIVAYPLCA